MRGPTFCLVLVSTLLALTPAPTSATTTGRVTGFFCGSGRCIRIPVTLAKTLSQQNDAVKRVSAPKPAPFYRITITGSGEGDIHRTILWVPSRKVWYLKDDGTPRLPGYWRTENLRTASALRQLARLVKPVPAPKRWILPA
jgi:hypothetical protein